MFKNYYRVRHLFIEIIDWLLLRFLYQLNNHFKLPENLLKFRFVDSSWWFAWVLNIIKFQKIYTSSCCANYYYYHHHFCSLFVRNSFLFLSFLTSSRHARISLFETWPILRWQHNRAIINTNPSNRLKRRKKSVFSRWVFGRLLFSSSLAIDRIISLEMSILKNQMKTNRNLKWIVEDLLRSSHPNSSLNLASSVS